MWQILQFWQDHLCRHTRLCVAVKRQNLQFFDLSTYIPNIYVHRSANGAESHLPILLSRALFGNGKLTRSDSKPSSWITTWFWSNRTTTKIKLNEQANKKLQQESQIQPHKTEISTHKSAGNDMFSLTVIGSNP